MILWVKFANWILLLITATIFAAMVLCAIAYFRHGGQ
jgi:hypothetical protein